MTFLHENNNRNHAFLAPTSYIPTPPPSTQWESIEKIMACQHKWEWKGGCVPAMGWPLQHQLLFLLTSPWIQVHVHVQRPFPKCEKIQHQLFLFGNKSVTDTIINYFVTKKDYGTYFIAMISFRILAYNVAQLKQLNEYASQTNGGKALIQIVISGSDSCSSITLLFITTNPVMEMAHLLFTQTASNPHKQKHSTAHNVGKRK